VAALDKGHRPRGCPRYFGDRYSPEGRRAWTCLREHTEFARSGGTVPVYIIRRIPWNATGTAALRTDRPGDR